MKKNLQRFGASVLAAAMVAQSVALPAAAETTKIDSSVAQSVAASAASAASAVQSLPKFTSTADRSSRQPKRWLPRVKCMNWSRTMPSWKRLHRARRA